MNKEDEQKIAERKREAENENLAGKVKTIMLYDKGHTVTKDDYDSEESYDGSDRVYESTNLKIVGHEKDYDGIWDGQAKVFYQGKKIFSVKMPEGTEKITGYIPGVWEEELDAWYQKVKPRPSRRLSQTEKDERVKKNFGI